MAIFNVPVGQQAYQATIMKSYAAAWTPYARTSNRYFAGPFSGPFTGGEFGAPALLPLGARSAGGHLVPIGGNAMLVTVSAGGAGYVVGDTITMVPINGGRPVIVRVFSAPAGVLATVNVVDPGSGFVAGGTGKNVGSLVGIDGQTVVQASTSGVGAGATFIGPGAGAIPAINWGTNLPNPQA